MAVLFLKLLMHGLSFPCKHNAIFFTYFTVHIMHAFLRSLYKINILFTANGTFLSKILKNLIILLLSYNNNFYALLQYIFISDESLFT